MRGFTLPKGSTVVSFFGVTLQDPKYKNKKELLRSLWVRTKCTLKWSTHQLP